MILDININGKIDGIKADKHRFIPELTPDIQTSGNNNSIEKINKIQIRFIKYLLFVFKDVTVM